MAVLENNDSSHANVLFEVLVGAQATFQSASEQLNSEETTNLQNNLTYICEVICGPRPSYQLEQYHEYGLSLCAQGPYPLCGLASVNNAMDPENFVSLNEIFDIADEMFVHQAQNNGLFANLMPLRTCNGNLNINVVEKCVLKSGYLFSWVQDNIYTAMNAGFPETYRNVIDNIIDERHQFSILLKQGNRDHFIVVKYRYPEFYYLDSLSNCIKILSYQDLENLFEAQRKQRDSAIILIYKESVDGPDTFRCRDDPTNVTNSNNEGVAEDVPTDFEPVNISSGEENEELLRVPNNFKDFMTKEWSESQQSSVLLSRKGMLELSVHDLLSLNDNKEINDKIIDFALDNLQESSPRSFFLPSHVFVDIMNSKFMPTKYIMKKHVGSYDRYIFPINENENHWILAVVDIKCNSYMEYDSLKPKRRALYQEKIINYLKNLGIHVSSLPKKKRSCVLYQGPKMDCGCCVIIHAMIAAFPHLNVTNAILENLLRNFRQLLYDFIIYLHHDKPLVTRDKTLLSCMLKCMLTCQLNKPQFGLRNTKKKPKVIILN